MRNRLLLSFWLVCIPAAPLWGQAPLQPEVFLDRTAFFVGEPIEYEVRVAHDPKIEFITDRLDQADMEMAPFEVQDVTVERSRRGQLNLLIVTLRLVTYEIAQQEWQIAPFNLFYVARNAPGSAEASAVQRLTVPAVPVAFRSSVPEESRRIRRDIRVENFSGAFWAFLSLGLLGVLIVGAFGANLAYQRLQRPVPEREERNAIEQRASQAVGLLLATSQPDGHAATTASFYGQMAAILREYSSSVSQKNGPSLTAQEVNEALVQAGEDADRARGIAELVAVGDRVRYADDGAQLAADRLEGVRDELRQLFRS